MTSPAICMDLDFFSHPTLSANVQESRLGLPNWGVVETDSQDRRVHDTSEISPGTYIKPVDELTMLVKRKLGENGVNRFNEFREYSAGWCMGKGKKLSFQSVAQLERFVHSAYKYLPAEPSIFLSEDGILQLQWEDADNFNIEVSFGPKQFEYFLESSDEEGMVPFRNISELLNKLFQAEL